VITRRGSDLPGTRVTGAGGSLGTRAANVSVGHLFDNGANLLVAATAYHSDGMTRLYYPEYDSPSSANGFARNMDDDGVHSMLGSLSIGAFSVRAGRGARDKDVPTAPFGTVFGDPSAHTRDIRTFADLKYEGRFTHGWRGLIRGSYDQYAYDSGWPYDYGDPIGVDTWRYLGRYDGLTTEIMANRALGSRHTLSLGTEWRGQLRLKQFTVDSLGVGLDDNRSALSWATFAQDEFAVTRRLLLNAGVRIDRSPGHGIDASPRAGLVYLPADGTSLKLLYGRAFRAPNAYELFFYPSMREQRHTLEAETISTTEAVWEQYLGKRVRGSVSLFRSDIAGQISLASGTDSTGNDALFYENAGGATATGLETELEFRGPRGAIARASHASVRAADPDTRARLTNSPGHTAKFSAIAPLGRHGLFLSGEGQYVGRRLTVQGQPLDGFFIQNLNLTFDGPRGLELSAGIQNLSDTRYADPGSAEHMQAGITQDGRTLRVSASVRF
jgi:iron complex outermembrane receptor protein